jgi:CHASE2 domain-containing sensor protein
MNKLLLSAFILLILQGCNGQKLDRKTHGSFEEEIVIVNIRGLDRAQIAEILDVLSNFMPEATAIDATFKYDTEADKDSRLISSLIKTSNLVMPSLISGFDGKQDAYARFLRSSAEEYLLNARTGFVNAILENDNVRTLKRFSTQENVAGRNEYHFSIMTAMCYDSLKTFNFLNKNPKIIDVDYKNGTRKFLTFEYGDFINKNVSKNDFHRKIVLLGDLGQMDYDIFYSPLNKDTTRPKPDMYGVIYMANIVAQVLEYK